MRLFFYILKHYLINFFILLLALAFVVTLIDFIQHVGMISGINREFLYFVYTMANSITLIYPLALVFGALLTLARLIAKNHLIAISSFGFSKKWLMKPFLTGVFLIYATVVALNFTQFAYSGDSAQAILDKRQLFTSLHNIFFKYNNNFAYVEEMDIIHKVLKGVTLYEIKDKKMTSITKIESARFNGSAWEAHGLKRQILLYKNGIPQGYTISHIDKKIILKGYYPKVVSLLYKGKRMTIQEGLQALKLLREQNVDSSKVLSAMYEKLVMPLFAPLVIVIIILFTPLSRRYMSAAKYYLAAIGATIVIWALLYGMNILSINGVLPADLAQPSIILIVAVVAIVLFIQERKRLH